MGIKERVRLNFVTVRLTFHSFHSAFFLANEYIRAQGHPGLADDRKVGDVYKHLHDVVNQYVGVASGQLEENALVKESVSKDT